MLTRRITLHTDQGGRIVEPTEWPPNARIEALIVTDEAPALPVTGPSVADIARELAAAGAGAAFGDPMEWQREVRHDRPLPGRGEDADDGAR